MFKTLFATAAVLAASLPVQAAPTPPLETVQASTCMMTKDDFFANVKQLSPSVFEAKPEALKKILVHINKARAAANLWALEADTFSVGLFSVDGQARVGLIMFKDSCVVPGTSMVVDPDDWLTFMTDVGITMDDFIPKPIGTDA